MNLDFRTGICVVLCCLFVGCGPSFEIVEVTGTVTQNGEPLNEVKVIFTPNPAEISAEEIKQGRGQLSHAITDEQGRYRLRYRGDSHEYGAEIGKHFVTAIDVFAENSRDNPIPPRISQKYMIAAETDIFFEVKSGEEQMEFDFELEPGPIRN